MSKQWLPLSEAAKLIGEAPSVVRRMVEEGELKGRRRSMTAPIEILESSLNDFLDAEPDDGEGEDDEFDRGYDEGFADASAERKD